MKYVYDKMKMRYINRIRDVMSDKNFKKKRYIKLI